MTTITITITTRRDTFSEDPADEIRRILRDEFRLDELLAHGEQILHDVEHNEVGHATAVNNDRR